ncbi:hypothetical protein [Actinosynnema sp. NPDC020468]|uniref:hypothetical protein n=1 Tax=Actinosynnema sp. NPDC020468 TaxID=3154488 RepID=UPI0033DF8B64
METDLTSAAATTVVEKLTTGAWQDVVTAIGVLWREVHPERGATIEAEMVDTRTAALVAHETGDRHALADLVSEWRSRLRRLAAEDPRVSTELRRLLAGWTREQGMGDAAIGTVTMTAQAFGHSRVTMAGRDVHITGS